MIIKICKDYSIIETFLRNNFSSPTHWPDWNIVVSKYFNTEFFYFCAFDNNDLIGICPVHKQQQGILSFYHSGQFHYIPFGGWIFSRELNYTVTDLPINMLGHFQSFCLPSVKEFTVKYSKKDILSFYKTLIIDLSDEYENIYKYSYNQRARKNIRKAERNGVKLEINNDIEKFYTYYIEACDKHVLLTLEKEFFVTLFKYIKNITIDILWAKTEKEYLGYLVIVSDKNYSFSWLTHNISGVPSLGQGHYLLAEAIKLSKQKGCRYYDLCYIEKERLPSIYEFKSNFSKAEYDIPYVSIKPLSFRVLNRMNALLKKITYCSVVLKHFPITLFIK